MGLNLAGPVNLPGAAPLANLPNANNLPPALAAANGAAPGNAAIIPPANADAAGQAANIGLPAPAPQNAGQNLDLNA